MSTQHNIAALFPGQASQYVGMAKVLTDNFPFAAEIFEEASDSIKINLLKLCNEGPESELQLTMNQQPAILTTSYAWFQVLKRTLDFAPKSGAGHSLGEYSALLASGTLSLSEAVALVRKRGELMQNAVPAGKGKMAAIIGLSDDKVRELCRLATEDAEYSLVVPANFNAPSQVVIAGHATAVDKAQTLATGATYPELKARKFIPLNVSAPFHCPLMKKVADDFTPFLQSVKWQKKSFPVVHNLDAQLKSDGDLIPLLRDQINNSVLWTSCVETLSKSGVQVFVEMGPSKVLTGLVKRISEGAQLFSMDSLEDLKKFETFLKEGAA